MEINDINMKLIEQKVKKNDIINLLDTSLLIKYIYNQLLLAKNSDKIKRELRHLAILMPKEFMSAVYIYSINN